MESKLKWIGLALLIVVLLALPFFNAQYLIHIAIMTLLNISMAITLMPLLRSGLFSVGHAAFMAIGAYTSAILVTKLGLNFWLSFPLGGVMSGICALAIGFPILRVKGLFFMLITMGLNEIVHLGINSWSSMTGGPSGIPGIPPPNPISLPIFGKIEFLSKLPFYYFALFLCVLIFLFIYRIWNSRIGSTCRAIAEDEDLAKSLGVNVIRYKMLLFCLCCFCTGIVGGFFAHYYGFLAPVDFSVWQSIYFLIYVQVGGMSILSGPVVGAALLTIVSEIFRFVAIYKPVIYGSLIVLIMILFPEGLISALSLLHSQLRMRGCKSI